MAMIGTLVVFAAGIAGAALSRLLADECKAWCPWFVERFVQRAVRRVPAAFRERFQEEWHGHLNEVPGDLAKLIVAAGFLVGARRISSQFGGADRVRFRDVINRCFDLALASFVTIAFGPVLALVAMALQIESGGPILAQEEIVGLHGRGLKLYRFRVNAVGGHSQGKITRVGMYLRKFRLNELPLVINLMRGDISLVGPSAKSPKAYDELSKLIPSYRDRLRVKPGITGLGQINVQYITSAEDCVREFACDQEYIQNRSARLNLYILLRTAVIVIRGSSEPS